MELIVRPEGGPPAAAEPWDPWPLLDGVHFPTRGVVGYRTATRQVGASLGSAAFSDLSVLSSAQSASRTPTPRRSRTSSRPKEAPKPEARRRSRTPSRARAGMRGDPDKPSSRDAFRNFDLTATGLAQEIYKPGPLRDLHLKGGPRMLRWQGGPNLAECHTNAHIQATSPGSQGGRREG